MTPSSSATGTASLTVGALPSSTGSSSGTPTSTPTPSGTLTPRGGRALPVYGFTVLVLGNGSVPVLHPRSEVLLRTAFHVYEGCPAGCASPTLDRSIQLPFRAFGDAYGNRAATLTAGPGRSTFLTGKLTRSEDGAQITVGMFDAYEGYVFGSKREPIHVSLRNTGFWDSYVPCQILRATPSGLIDDPYYCNGFNPAEPALGA